MAQKDWLCKMAVARNPGAPLGLLQRLLEEDPSLGYHMAENPSAPLDVLLKLAEGEHAWRVAGNPSLPEERLRRLAKDESWRVRVGVGRNTNAPGDVLEELAKDESPAVREAVAQNPATPLPTLTHLAKDPYETVRMGVAKNPAYPLEVLKGLDEGAALENLSLSLEGLVQLIAARFERTERLLSREAYKLLPLLDLVPKKPALWLAIWEGLKERERRILEEHLDARGMLLLGRLGS